MKKGGRTVVVGVVVAVVLVLVACAGGALLVKGFVAATGRVQVWNAEATARELALFAELDDAYPTEEALHEGLSGRAASLLADRPQGMRFAVLVHRSDGTWATLDDQGVPPEAHAWARAKLDAVELGPDASTDGSTSTSDSAQGYHAETVAVGGADAPHTVVLVWYAQE